MTTPELYIALPTCAPESLHKVLNGGIPADHIFTVYSSVKPRSAVSMLDGISKGLHLSPSNGSTYPRNTVFFVNLEG